MHLKREKKDGFRAFKCPSVVNFINILRQKLQSQDVAREKLRKALSYKKVASASKMLMKLAFATTIAPFRWFALQIDSTDHIRNSDKLNMV
jgi:hypothetical protein